VLLADRQTMDIFRFWQVGSVAGRDLDILLAGLPFLLVGAVLGLAAARPLDALALGHDTARGLGRRTGLDRVVVGLAVVLLTGTATALAGPIAFVGLVVPHAVRAVVGGGHVSLLPLSVGFGAVLTTIADTLGRMVLPPTEVQVGIMTAVVGVPVFVWFLRRGRMSGL
jgi:iron complex transport system permease protein